jgi:hypothetical protein
VFDNFGAYDDVEWIFGELIENLAISAQELEAALRIRAARPINSLLAQVNPNDPTAAFDKFTTGRAIAATNIENSCAWF